MYSYMYLTVFSFESLCITTYFFQLQICFNTTSRYIMAFKWKEEHFS